MSPYDQAVRQIQNQFIELLTASGFFKRVADGMSAPLFDKESPTAIQLQRDLYPRYLPQMTLYIREHEARGKPEDRTSRRSHRQSSGAAEVDQGTTEAVQEE